ncbi:MAG: CvpA family protein [Ignavibacteriales bacterium]
MNYLDYIIFGLIVIGFILGFKDGLVRKIIGLLGIFLGIFLAVKLSGKAGKLIAPLLDQELYLAEIAAGLIIFVLTVILASVVKRLVHPHDKVSKLANQILGGMTGIVQIVFFMSGIFLFLNIFKIPEKKVADNSFLYGSVYNVMPKTIDFMIGGKDFVKDYIENKDKNSNGEQKKIVTEKDSTTVKKKVSQAAKPVTPKKAKHNSTGITVSKK